VPNIVHTRMMIEGLQRRVEIMERSLNMLNDDERKIIELKYFQNQPWYNIAYEVKQSESTCKRHRVHAVKKLMFAIFGEE
jgi:DNA-directed RNA polymerase specialized sigma subunit